MPQQEAYMKQAEHKDFRKPDEIREFPKGRVELIKIGGATVGRAVFEPGWKWSTSVQPLAKTKSCEAPHFQYHVSGVLRILMDDGTEFDCRAGDVSLLPSGHDAWVIGNEPAVVVDFQGMLDYASAH
jgi:hypothetical protein